VSQIRIIAGEWRRRKIPVPEIQGLRPTPDRIRETLFNWLSSDCRGAVVLDCFAGSGVLGFETSSRAAKSVTLIEKDKAGWENLKTQAQRLGATNIDVLCGDVLDLIPQLQQSYSLVFIDPPYALPELRQKVLESLLAHKKLTDGARIYLEWPQGESFELPSADFQWLKKKKAGSVHYAIAEWCLSR
ncbi:MAG: 16S rRNA (guanine(966)-N(2))-methyltransferase RsmD, partial [Gammaproteobacteria bacterium]|nr:16S rRNA (guanine(966)-N(2))-methyltransferase RsmD [Gammaproteobacteria bacterium]